MSTSNFDRSRSGSLVLIVGDRDDPHVGAVVDQLTLLGAQHVVFNPDEPGAALSYGPVSDTVRMSVGTAVRTFDVAEFEAVWWRRKPTMQQLLKISFADRESQYALEGLAELLRAARWINPHHADNAMRYKWAQLALAARVGLIAPPTLISNDPDAVLEFVTACGGAAIYKCLTWFASPGKVLYTSAIDGETVRRHRDSVARAPGIYQPRIEKLYELRVTVVGEVAFTVRIDSQERDDTRLDWRRNVAALAHRRASLPPDVESALMAFHHASGLVFGAYDFIVTPQGEHVFLEVNTLGQWLWIEHLTGLPIARALAFALLGRAVPAQDARAV